MPETNPLVAERKDTTTPLAGTFLLEDGEALVQAINDKDWVAGGLAVVGGAFDAAAAASDPIGTLIAMGLGWVLDHVQPFNTWLEQLTGDADQVKAHATTWKNVQKHLQATAETMASHITTDLADMNGRTITAYQGAAGDMAQAINAAGTWAGAIGTALEVTAFIVQFVHDFVRDAISEVVGSILSYAAELIATVGLAWPIVAEQIATRIASLIGQVGRNVKNLVTSARNLVKKLTDLKSLFHTLKNKLDDLFKKLHKTDTPTTPTKGPTPTTGGNTSPHGDTGSTGGSSGAGNTSPPGGSTHPGGTSSGSAAPTTSPGHTGGNTNPTSGANTTGTTSSAPPTSGANTPTHTDGSHTTMTADSAPSTNNSTTHPSSTTGPDGPSGHTTDNPNPTQTGHTTGEPDTPKRALDEDPTTHPTDPVTAEPRHADEPPETSSGGGGDDGNNHGGGDDGNNHGGGGDDGNNHGDGDDHNNHNNDGDDGNNHNNDGDDHNNHNNDGDDGNNHGDGDDGNNHNNDGDDGNNHNNDGDDGNNHGDGDDGNNHNNDGDDGNNHGDGGDPELERLRNQPPETIDDALKVVREQRPYNGPNADVGKVMDDSTGLVDNPKEIFGTTDGKPNSYNDWAKEYLDEKGDVKWPDPEELPVENGLDKSKGIERYDNVDDYISKHGTMVDRVGGPFGSYLGGVDDGRVATYAERAISPESVTQSYYQYELTGVLPEGYGINRGVVYPWHGTPGGASQVQIFGPSGKALSVNELLEAGILKGATDFVGLP